MITQIEFKTNNWHRYLEDIISDMFQQGIQESEVYYLIKKYLIKNGNWILWTEEELRNEIKKIFR